MRVLDSLQESQSQTTSHLLLSQILAYGLHMHTIVH